jgi:hypothetical protein
MVSTPIRSWARPTAMVSGGVAMVCLAGAWHAPISTHPTHPGATPAATAAASGVTVRLVAEITSLRPGWPAAGGPGGGLGGGSGGSPGDAVAPSPTRHQSNSGASSSTSGGSVNRQASASHDAGPVQTAFNTVGRWLGLSHDAPSSSDSSATQDSTTAMPKQIKSAGAGAGGEGTAAGKSATTSSASSSASGVGGMIHSVVCGVGRLIGSLFGH